MANGHQQDGLNREDEYSGALKMGVLVQIVAALLSLALVIAIAVWAYKLIVRDVSGIPVIAASQSPMREAPDNPGGKSTENQGLSVNAVAEAEEVDNPDQVVLAPRPVDLGEDALAPNAMDKLFDTAPEATASDEVITGLVGNGDTSQNDESRRGLSDEQASSTTAYPLNIDRLANQIADSDSVEQGQKRGTAGIQSIDVEKALLEALADEKVRVSAYSLRPRARPSGISPTSEGATGQGVTEISALDIPVGTALVQLGAFDSEAIARTAWVRLSQKFPNLLVDRSRVVQETKRSGRTFYRLRAEGFADLNDARRFCAFLVSSNEDCIPVTVR